MAGSSVAAQGRADMVNDPPPVPPKKKEHGPSPREVVEGRGDDELLQHRDQQRYFLHGDHLTKPANGTAEEHDDSHSHLGPSGVLTKEKDVPQMYPASRDTVNIPEWQLASDSAAKPPPLPPKPAFVSSPNSKQKQHATSTLSAAGGATNQKSKQKSSYQQFSPPRQDERNARAGLSENGEEQHANTSKSDSTARLKTPTVEQRQDHREAYEQFGSGQSSVQGEREGEGENVRGENLYRAPSLEWDSADLPLQRDFTSRTAEEVQETWRREHESRMQHSYSEVVIPEVQQRWIEEHDRTREQRSYEEVDFDWNFHSAAAAQPSVQPQGRNKGKRKSQEQPDTFHESVSSTLRREVESINRPLPEGWQAEVSHGQIIYWHIPTGKIQFVPPTGLEPSTSTFSDDETTGSEDIQALQEMVAKKQGLRVVGVYLGWVEVESLGPPEGLSDLCGRHISSVVDQRRLSTCEEGDGDEGGQKVYLEVRGNRLKIVDHLKRTLICKQRLTDIRVFAIGSNNERDFGYIAFDSDLRLHKCQVFRLHSPAQSFLGSLLNSVKSLSEEEQQEWDSTVKATLQEQRLRHLSGHSSTPSSREKTPSAGELDEEEEEELVSSFSHTEDSYSYQRFECIYMGNTTVPEAFGMHMVNDALVQLAHGKARWMAVYLDISPQCIKLVDKDASNLSFMEHRVRFISFLGLGADERTCGYVLDSGGNCYQCYGFQMEPTAEKLCLALHRACRERFERVLQVHPEARVVEEEIRKRQSPRSQSWIRRLWNRKSANPDLSSAVNVSQGEESLVDTLRRFSVYYLGSQPVMSSSNTDEVMDVVQTLTSAGPSGGTVQLEVSSSSLTLYDPSKLWYKRRAFPAKNITFLVGKDKNLAFVLAEGAGPSKGYKCHVLSGAEFEVDARSIVNTIQNTVKSEESHGR